MVGYTGWPRKNVTKITLNDKDNDNDLIKLYVAFDRKTLSSFICHQNHEFL